MQPPSPSQHANLRALLDRLIPADDFPGALGAGTEQYLLQQFSGDCAAEAPDLWRGLTQLDAEASVHHGEGVCFNALPAAQQDALLSALERNCPVTTWPASITAEIFFRRMVELAHEGFYADPGNGGNRDRASWRMLDYDSRIPST